MEPVTTLIISSINGSTSSMQCSINKLAISVELRSVWMLDVWVWVGVLGPGL